MSLTGSVRQRCHSPLTPERDITRAAARPVVAKKLGVYTSVGYFYTEFDNVIETPRGRFENEWDASSFNIFVGVMVYPFK